MPGPIERNQHGLPIRRPPPVLRWGIAIAVLTAILVGQLAPRTPGPAQPLVSHPWGDKIAHVGMYAALAGSLYLVTAGLGWPRRRRAVLAFGAAIAIGLVVETLQTWVPRRAFDPLDLAANVVGAVAITLWPRIAKRLEAWHT